MPQLPPEIVLRILECLAPYPDVARPPSDPEAQSIRAFTRVCRYTYTLAIRLLYRHCLWIDSPDKLMKLMTSLDVHQSRLRSTNSALPAVNVMDSLQNLYLAPFKSTLDDLPTAQWVFDLFAMTRHSLRRLVVDFPLHTLQNEADHLDVRPKLRAAFMELQAVEEFTSIGNDLRLDLQLTDMASSVPQGPVWAHWSQLRSLSLFGAETRSLEYKYLSNLKNLQTLQLVQPDAGDESGGMWSLGRFPDIDMSVVFFIAEDDQSRNPSRLLATFRGWLRFFGTISDAADNVDSGNDIKMEWRHFEGADVSNALIKKHWTTDHATNGTLFNLGYLDKQNAFRSD